MRAELRKLLVDRRHELGLSRSKTAEMAGFSQSKLWDLENGKITGSPQVRTLEAWVEALGGQVTLDFICKPCKEGSHSECKSGTSCDCQHRTDRKNV